MRTISVPELRFSHWYRWENRDFYQLKQFPGVYVIAITTRYDLEGEEVHYKDVVYIGMTHAKNGLIRRWKQLDNAIHGKPGHSGGNRVYEAKSRYDDWDDYLYVAAMGIECNVVAPTDQDYIKMGWVAYLEFEAFAQYYQTISDTTRRHPIYNKR